MLAVQQFLSLVLIVGAGASSEEFLSKAPVPTQWPAAPVDGDSAGSTGHSVEQLASMEMPSNITAGALASPEDAKAEVAQSAVAVAGLEGVGVGAAAQSAAGGVGGCTMYAGRNCYGNGNNYEPCQGEHGGWSHAPDEYSYKVTSIWECTHICNGDSSCYAVVYLPSQSKCFFRYNILLSRCDYSTGGDHFDTYICR